MILLIDFSIFYFLKKLVQLIKSNDKKMDFFSKLCYI